MEAPDRVEERTLLDTRRSPWAPAGPRGFDEFSHHRWINLQKIWRCIEIMEAPESAARLKDPQRLAVDGSIPVSLFLFLGSWNSKSGIDVRFGSWHLKNGIDCRQASFGMNYAEKPPYLATFFGEKILQNPPCIRLQVLAGSWLNTLVFPFFYCLTSWICSRNYCLIREYARWRKVSVVKYTQNTWRKVSFVVNLLET